MGEGDLPKRMGKDHKPGDAAWIHRTHHSNAAYGSAVVCESAGRHDNNGGARDGDICRDRTSPPTDEHGPEDSIRAPGQIWWSLIAVS